MNHGILVRTLNEESTINNSIKNSPVQGDDAAAV